MTHPSQAPVDLKPDDSRTGGSARYDSDGLTHAAEATRDGALVKNPVDDVKSSGVRLSSRAQFESAETIVSHPEYSKGRLNFRFLLSAGEI
jgi:hypothetical protein